jgi:sugar phosphate isomerase/epimerase
MLNIGTKHPPAAPITVGLHDLARLELNTESPASLSSDDLRPFADLIVSCHAPSGADGQRLNVASKDDEFREWSINQLLLYVERVGQLPKLKKVIVHPPRQQTFDENQDLVEQGAYERLIDSIKRLGEFARGLGLDLLLENQTRRFTGITDDMPASQIDWSGRNLNFASAPEEWIKICEDVDHPNVGLCLDSSHACTFAQTADDFQVREELVLAFLSKPHLIRHVHWSDNYLFDARGRQDSHLLIGKGSLSQEVHRTIKGLDATVLLEHYYSLPELEEELEFIRNL